MEKRKEKADQNAVAELTREWLYKENKWLWEENQKLKEKIKRLEFDVDAWHQLKLLLEWEIEKLREELSAYDREYFDEDKKAKNIYKSQRENILMWKF